MDFEELPLTHLLVTLESYTHCRPLCTSSAEDELYLAVIHGAFESLVRSCLHEVSYVCKGAVMLRS
jgi:hypothetical protein